MTGNSKFFLGSDSAPHPIARKSISNPHEPCAAGIYTSPILLPLVAHTLESFGALDRLPNFASIFGRRFYKKEGKEGTEDVITLRRGNFLVPSKFVESADSVIPFMAGKTLNWIVDS